MTWTQGQPSRSNQSPFIDPEKEPRNTRMSQSYTKGNDRRNDPNQKYNQSAPRTTHNRSEQVAATFTQEGLQTFSMIFSSAVEAAIIKSLPGLVEQAVQKQMNESLRELRLEISQTISGFLADLVHNAQTSVEKRIHDMIDEQLQRNTSLHGQASFPSNRAAMAVDMAVEEPQAPEPVEHVEKIAEEAMESEPVQPGLNGTVDAGIALSAETPLEREARTEPKTENTTAEEPAVTYESNRRPERELDIVINALKSLDRPVRTNELDSLIPDVAWGNNPSIKMSYFMNRSGGQIERVGRGLYQYRQPTV